jgi:hypothetical protein
MATAIRNETVEIPAAVLSMVVRLAETADPKPTNEFYIIALHTAKQILKSVEEPA